MTVLDDREEAERHQQAVIDHNGEGYVEACPGSGKTRTLVHRVARISAVAKPRSGIAVLSFTNSAVDEFRERCCGQSILERLCFPNFIGTFDGFLNQFVVLPFGIPGCESRPVIVDSWKDALVIPKGGGKGIELSRFDAATGKIDPSKNREVAGLLKEKQADYEKAASGYRAALNRKGLLCAEDARLVVKKFLTDRMRADAVGKALAARFREVLVDEAQDCNADDVAVLEWLKGHGIPLVVVCDPDQAIFEFRKGKSDSFRTFATGFPRLMMNGNFRSSKTICAAAGTMRTRGSADLAVGDHHDANFPVILIPYGKKATPVIGAKFTALASELGVTDCIVLAHKRLLAERASGAPSHPSGAGGKLTRLARLVAAFNVPGITGKQRDATLKAMIRLLMEIEGRPADEIVSLRPLAASPEMDREFRRKAIEVLTGLPTSCDDVGRDGWMQRARTLVGKMVALEGGKTIKQTLPDGGDWQKELGAPPLSATAPCATVHEAKGRHYDGVCLVLDKDSENAVADWENRASATSEALRVLYVGLTRAKRLLVIALPTELLARVDVILSAGGVPCQKEEFAATASGPRRSVKPTSVEGRRQGGRRCSKEK